MPKTQTFTPEQLKRFAEYVRIQRGGRFNMFDARARKMTNQTSDEWVFNMEHYDALEAAAAAPVDAEQTGDFDPAQSPRRRA